VHSKTKPSLEPSAEDKLKATETERASLAAEVETLRNRNLGNIIRMDAWQKSYCALLELHRILLQDDGMIAPGGGTLVIKNNLKLEGN
jgi:hypothetical protein